ncbi:MAG: citrate synthase [Chloroflexota bacterium]
MSKDTLTITDNRTNRTYEVPIQHDTIKAMDLRQIKVNDDDFGMMSYDPAFKNTASTKSNITFIAGDKGILRYRGYPIEQLAEKASFPEVSYLILFGELPTADQLADWNDEITHHTLIHENMKEFFDVFRYDAHPMGMFISSVSALSTFYPEARNISDSENRLLQVKRLIAKVPTLAAFAYRHIMGLPINYPNNDLSYSGNFLNMMFKMVEPKYEPDPILERALDVLFTLHADHEQNCGTNAMRAVGSSHVDPYSAVAAAAAALSGPLHGGANEAVLRMLNEIGDMKNIPAFIEKVKTDRSVRLMGFGHRVYKNYDPRAKIIKNVADQVLSVTGANPLLDIALELERIALEDDFFIQKKLYPNVDFYSGLIYQAMGLPTSMFTVMFAIPRTVGWLAQWMEYHEDREQAIARPRQIYLGEGERDFVSMDQR